MTTGAEGTSKIIKLWDTPDSATVGRRMAKLQMVEGGKTANSGKKGKKRKHIYQLLYINNYITSFDKQVEYFKGSPSN